jgi:hypothetical protein
MLGCASSLNGAWLRQALRDRFIGISNQWALMQVEDFQGEGAKPQACGFRIWRGKI